MNTLLALLDRWRAVRLRAGAWPSSAVIAALLATFAAWIVLDNHLLHFSSGVPRSTYDLMVGWPPAAP